MMRRVHLLWINASAVILFLGCTHAPALQAPPVALLHGSLAEHPIDHVVIVAIDGLERDTLLTYLKRDTPKRSGGLHDLLGVRVEADGLSLTKAMAVSQATTVFPSYTYPAWTSLFTGVFPGTHGITGNSLFFKDRRVARYYTEYHVDAVKVQLEKDFLSRDISDRVKTLYEYIGQSGGQSLVIHHMITRGSGEGAQKPDFDTLWSYQRNRSYAVDENTLWQAVQSLQDYNSGRAPGAPLQLPTLMTMYFSGLDHAEHLSPEDPERARLDYLQRLDDLIATFVNGSPSIVRHHYPSPMAEPTTTDPIAWPGLRGEPVMGRTLFVLVSDHGHSPTDWATAVGIEDLKVIFNELTSTSGRTYTLETPVFIEKNWFSMMRGLFSVVQDGTISERANVVATLNGGALGLYVKPDHGQWTDPPTYSHDIAPLLEHLLLTLHKNQQGPEAVLYNDGTQYVYVPYRYDGSTIQLLPLLSVAVSPLHTDRYPAAEHRLNGLASRLAGDPVSAPDVILLADRSKHFTYANKKDWRVIEALNVETHRHFHSDHGHLNASDSLVPIMFWMGGYEGQTPLETVCEASIVDVAPTILDILGLLPSFTDGLQRYPPEVKGQSLKELMVRILSPSANARAWQDEARLCSARLTGRESLR